ncbi:MAG: YHS domain-containing (seleno)protein [Bacteroidota bacterium]
MKYLVILLLSLQASAGHQNLKGGLAISGYDPVSYFEDSGPRKGTKAHQFDYQGATYFFADRENQQAFAQSPEQYIPAYGGWCAYAMGASGDKVKIDPKTYKIIDDRLYLFYNFWGNNTLTSWNDDEEVLKTDADRYWTQLLATQ